MKPIFYMQLALNLARSVSGLTAPNPPVGAVFVRGKTLLASGVHRGPGLPHAEIDALDQIYARNETPKGATLFVTLEPCCHSGPAKRTPPCAQRLIKEGISEIWIACLDPNPEVAGKGVQLLRQAGIEVHLGLLEKEAQKLLAAFRVWITQKRPFIHLKWAQTLDGYAAAQDGSSQWISSQKSRQAVQHLRSQCDALLIGAGTLRTDNPALTIRDQELKKNNPQPARLIFAGQQSLPEDSKVFQDEYRHKTWVIAPLGSKAAAQAEKLTPGRVLVWQDQDWAALGQMLLQAGHFKILVEAGPTLLASLLKVSWWDQLSVFVAPKLLGNGLKIPGDLEIATLTQALDLGTLKWKTCGTDFLGRAVREVKECLLV